MPTSDQLFGDQALRGNCDGNIKRPAEICEFLQTVRRFVDEQLLPLEEEAAQNDDVPIGLVSQMADCSSAW